MVVFFISSSLNAVGINNLQVDGHTSEEFQLYPHDKLLFFGSSFGFILV